MAATVDGLVFAIDKTILDMKRKLNSFPLSGDGKQNILTALKEIENATEELQKRGSAEQWDIRPRLQSFLEALQAFPEAMKIASENAEELIKTTKSFTQDAIWVAEWVKHNFPTQEASTGAVFSGAQATFLRNEKQYRH